MVHFGVAIFTFLSRPHLLPLQVIDGSYKSKDNRRYNYKIEYRVEEYPNVDGNGPILFGLVERFVLPLGDLVLLSPLEEDEYIGKIYSTQQPTYRRHDDIVD